MLTKERRVEVGWGSKLYIGEAMANGGMIDDLCSVEVSLLLSFGNSMHGVRVENR